MIGSYILSVMQSLFRGSRWNYIESVEAVARSLATALLLPLEVDCKRSLKVAIVHYRSRDLPEVAGAGSSVWCGEVWCVEYVERVHFER